MPDAKPVSFTGALSENENGWALGSLRIRPYGMFAADVIYSTQRAVSEASPLYIVSEELDDDPYFVLDVRRTRFGLDISGPSLDSLGESAARVEIDFRGDFVTENRASVLLRHAYWELKGDNFRFLAGQTTDVISPLLPHTINYAFLRNAGNIGFRRAQIRWERYWSSTDDFHWTLAASINQDIVTDFPSDPGVRRETADWPVIQARLGLRCGDESNGRRPIELGISGHIGETGFDFVADGPPPLNLPATNDARFETWSVNLDLYAPITDRFGFQGEAYWGANLSPFLGGIGQGVCPCLRAPIRDIGGWGELWLDISPAWHVHVGYGVDDPENSDSQLGRTFNHVMYANVICDLTDAISSGIELSFWKTYYHDTRRGLIPADQLTPSTPGEAIVVDWMTSFSF